MDMEDPFELDDHYLDLDGDNHAIFDIPEEVLETAQDFASEHSSADEQDDDASAKSPALYLPASGPSSFPTLWISLLCSFCSFQDNC